MQTFHTDNLENYIVDQYILGKRDAEKIVEEFLNDFRSRIKDIDDDQLLVNAILINLISYKKTYYNNRFSEFSEIISGLKKRYNSKKIDFSNEVIVAENFASYALDFFDFLNLNYFSYYSRIKNIREFSKGYYIAENFELQSSFLFEKLNSISKIENFNWNWINFEEGLKEVLKNDILLRDNIEIDYKNKIQIIKLEESNKREKLNDKVKKLKRKIESLNYKVDYTKEFFNKYYYSYQLLITDTYFGDNQPFLYNLFLFLRHNNYYSYGWSYFHSCTQIGNNEIIPLECNKKLNIVGRILYNLKDFLKVDYRNDSISFFQSKFYINNKPIGDNFKTNHMKPIYDPIDDPILVLVDDFFEKQKKIYNKY